MCFEDDEENPCSVGFPRRLLRCGSSGERDQGSALCIPLLSFSSARGRSLGSPPPFTPSWSIPPAPRDRHHSPGEFQDNALQLCSLPRILVEVLFSSLSRNHILEPLSNPLPATSLFMEEPNGKHPQDPVLAFVMARIPCGMLQPGWV